MTQQHAKHAWITWMHALPSKTLLCLHISIKPIHVCTKSIPAPRSQWAGSQNGGYFDLQHCSCLFWKDSFISFFSLTECTQQRPSPTKGGGVLCASLFFIHFYFMRTGGQEFPQLHLHISFFNHLPFLVLHHAQGNMFTVHTHN